MLFPLHFGEVIEILRIFLNFFNQLGVKVILATINSIDNQTNVCQYYCIATLVCG